MSTNLTRRSLRRSPFLPALEPGDGIENRLRRFFDDAFMSPEALGVVPAVDVSETPQEYTCLLELPGLKQKDIELDFENGVLTIKGEKRDERETSDPEKRFHVWERSYGSFQRSFTFADKVDQAKIMAELKDGVLTIHLPKTAEEKAKTHKIEIAVK